GTVTTPSSPTSGVTGLGVGVNTFRWTISNGVCTPSADDIIINRSAVPTVSAAGPDQNVCATTAALAGNAPAVGTGTWTVITGSATVTTPSSPTSGVTGLSTGVNTFRWTIANGVCTSSTDDITITKYDLPTTSAAGPDQNVCAATATLAGNTPAIGTGTWTVIAGSGTVTTPTSPTSGVTGLSVGANTFRWTISNGPCTSSADDIIITRTAAPTVSAAGPDQNVCAATATLAGNTPAIGTGAWTVITGSAAVTTPTSPTSGVTGLSVGTNTFRWTISNGICTSSVDDIIIIRSAPPSLSSAGPNQSICGTTTTLLGNNPGIGTGIWTVISGPGTLTTPTSPVSGVTGMSTGTSSFAWTISNGACPPSVDTVAITVLSIPTIAAAGPDQSVCSATATLAGNTPVVGTGAWTVIAGGGTITTPASPTSGVTGLSIGTNTFRWTISNGTCVPSADDVTITMYAPPDLSFAGPDQNVCGATATLTGSAPTVGTGAWTVITGTGIVTSPTSPTSGVTGLSIGINTFRWTVSNGTCTSSVDDVTITQLTPPTIATAGADQNICDDTTTLAGNTPSVGTGAWSVIAGTGAVTTPSSPASAVTGLSIGINTFRWTISNGSCTPSTDDIAITVSQLPTSSAAGPDQSTCGTTASLAGNIAGVGTGTWTVISGTGTVTSPSSPTSGVNGLSIGTSAFAWTISNGTCPASADTVSIAVTSIPTIAAAGADQSVCSDTSSLSANTAVVGTGAWTTITGSGIVTTPSSPASTVTGLSIGANTFRWTISNGTCAPSSDDITITRSAPPTLSSAGPDQTICGITTVFAGNTPAVGTGAWTLITGTGAITTPSSPTSGVSGLNIGMSSFAWTISNGACPASADTVAISATAGLTVANAGIDQSVCSDTSSLAGNTAVSGTGSWTVITGGGTVTASSSPTSGVTGLSAGINTFCWTISNGMCPPSIDTIVIVRALPPTAAAAGADFTVCSSGSVLNGNTPASGTGIWTILSGTGSIGSPGSPSPTVTGMGAGINSFAWTISSGSCPPSSDTVSITVNPATTTADAGSDSTICSSSSVLNGNTPVTGTGSWSIVSGGATLGSPSAQNSTVSGLTPGLNTFVWTITSGSCPPSSDTVVITVDQPPTIANAGADFAICSASSALNGNVPLLGTGAWTIVSGSGTFTSASSPATAISGMGVGVNTFAWTISNGSCPSSSDTVIVTVNPPSTIADAGSDSTICDSAFVLAGNIPGTGTGMWSLVSGSGSIANPSSAATGVSGLNPGSNIFIWTISSLTCPSSTDSIEIFVDTPPTSANAGADIYTNLNSISLDANSPSSGNGIWGVASGAGTFSNAADSTATVSGLVTGANVFTWTISNGACPSSTDQMTVFVSAVEVPNGFSPNGDNLNDVFEIPGLTEYKNVVLNVFNRWGNLVYNSDDYKNNWDGKNNKGGALSDDTYYYTLKLKEDMTLSGYVIIKR
ncbi:MAG: gliding motility-associated C-terminal domain-containing protein, partial [Bacteroidia bacterium]